MACCILIAAFLALVVRLLAGAGLLRHRNPQAWRLFPESRDRR